MPEYVRKSKTRAEIEADRAQIYARLEQRLQRNRETQRIDGDSPNAPSEIRERDAEDGRDPPTPLYLKRTHSKLGTNFESLQESPDEKRLRINDDVVPSELEMQNGSATSSNSYTYYTNPDRVSIDGTTYLKMPNGEGYLDEDDEAYEKALLESRERNEEFLRRRPIKSQDQIRRGRETSDIQRIRTRQLKRVEALRDVEKKKGNKIVFMADTPEKVKMAKRERFDALIADMRVPVEEDIMRSFRDRMSELNQQTSKSEAKQPGPEPRRNGGGDEMLVNDGDGVPAKERSKKKVKFVLAEEDGPLPLNNTDKSSELPKFGLAEIESVMAMPGLAANQQKSKESLRARLVADFKKRINNIQNALIKRTTANYQAKREKAAKIKAEVFEAAARLQEEWDALQERNNPPEVVQANQEIEERLHKLSKLAEEPIKKLKKVYTELTKIDRDLLVQRNMIANLSTKTEGFFEMFKAELDTLEKSTFENLKAREQASLERQFKRERMALEALNF